MLISEKHIKEVSNIVSKFLEKNGGYPNGYRTYIEGVVSPNSFYTLNLYTPSFEDKTIKEGKELSFQLEHKIKSYLKKNKLTNYVLRFEKTPLEHGAYRIFLRQIIEPTVISLYNNERHSNTNIR